MKKTLLILSFLFCAIISFGQLPIKQKLGSDSTEIDATGAIKTKLINFQFQDTTTANTQRISQYAGALIYTTGNNELWLRDLTTTKWINISSGGGGNANIYNIYNTSITNVQIINQVDSSVTVEICTGSGACDTTTFNTTIIYKIGTTVSFIDSTHLQICGVDSLTLTDTCNIFSIAAQQLYIFQNGVQENTAGVVEGGGNLAYHLIYNMNLNKVSYYNGTLQYEDAGLTYGNGKFLVGDGLGDLSYVALPNSPSVDGYVLTPLVIWIDSLHFHVTQGTYNIGGIQYTSQATELYLDTLIGSNPRQDAFLSTTTPASIDSTGTPAADPEVPQPSDNELLLTSVLINAGDNIPANVNTTTVYDEGVGTAGGEYDATASAGQTAAFTNTTAPYHLTHDGSIGAIASNRYILFTNNTTAQLSDYTVLDLYIRLKATFANNVRLTFQFLNGNTVINTNVVQIGGANSYGFVRTTVGTYMEISIPITAFARNSDLFTALRILFTNSNSSGFYIDWIRLQGGIQQGGGGNGTGTVTQFSSGSLSPLFTTSVANATTTPALSFTLSNFIPHGVLYNPQNISAVPIVDTFDVSVVKGLMPITNLPVIPAGYYIGSSDGIHNVLLPITLPAPDTIAAEIPLAVRFSGDPAIPDTLLLNYGNGLQVVNDSLMFGGTLIDDVSLNFNGRSLTFNTGTTQFLIQTATSGYTPLKIVSTDATTVDAENSGGLNYFGLNSGGGIVSKFITYDNSTNTVLTNMDIQRWTNNTAAAGIGTSIDFHLSTTGALHLSNQIISEWTNTTEGLQTSQLIFKGIDSSSIINLLILDGTGYMQMKTMTVAVAETITPAEGMIIFVSDTDGTFTSKGFWGYQNGSWAKL